MILPTGSDAVSEMAGIVAETGSWCCGDAVLVVMGGEVVGWEWYLVAWWSDVREDARSGI